MIVIHFESGLGNQMLNYAEYLAVKETHPNDIIYIETILYELVNEQNKTSMWNGYELETIFGIVLPNISELFSEIEWIDIINTVKRSEFWLKGWDYSSIIVDALEKYGYKLKNYITSRGRDSVTNRVLNRVTKTRLGYTCKRAISVLLPELVISRKRNPQVLFRPGDTDFYSGQSLLFLYKGNQIELIEDQLKDNFSFPGIVKETTNWQFADRIMNCNSIALHVRRGDMLSSNEYLYKNGFFKRAVNYIKRNVIDPIFFIFGDDDGIIWVKEKPSRVGLNENDRVEYVNWNKGADSYRDMQLMSLCKGIIITNSSFGWWASFLNSNKGKITISPFVNYNTTNWV